MRRSFQLLLAADPSRRTMRVSYVAKANHPNWRHAQLPFSVTLEDVMGRRVRLVNEGVGALGVRRGLAPSALADTWDACSGVKTVEEVAAAVPPDVVDKHPPFTTTARPGSSRSTDRARRRPRTPANIGFEAYDEELMVAASAAGAVTKPRVDVRLRSCGYAGKLTAPKARVARVDVPAHLPMTEGDGKVHGDGAGVVLVGQAVRVVVFAALEEETLRPVPHECSVNGVALSLDPPSTASASSRAAASATVRFEELGRGFYAFTYVPRAGNDDWKRGKLPVYLVLTDVAGNVSKPVTEVPATCPEGRLTLPVISSITFEPESGYVVPGDVVKVKLTEENGAEDLTASAAGAAAVSASSLVARVNGIDVSHTLRHAGEGVYYAKYTAGVDEGNWRAGQLPVEFCLAGTITGYVTPRVSSVTDPMTILNPTTGTPHPENTCKGDLDVPVTLAARVYRPVLVGGSRGWADDELEAEYEGDEGTVGVGERIIVEVTPARCEAVRHTFLEGRGGVAERRATLIGRGNDGTGNVAGPWKPVAGKCTVNGVDVFQSCIPRKKVMALSRHADDIVSDESVSVDCVRFVYTLSEGDGDWTDGQLAFDLTLADPGGNVVRVTPANLTETHSVRGDTTHVCMDGGADAPRVSPASGTVGVGADVEIIVPATEPLSRRIAGEAGACGCVINGVDCSRSFVEKATGVYAFKYQVAQGENDWAPGELSIDMMLFDVAGNESTWRALAKNALSGLANSPKLMGSVKLTPVSGYVGVGDVVTVDMRVRAGRHPLALAHQSTDPAAKFQGAAAVINGVDVGATLECLEEEGEVRTYRLKYKVEEGHSPFFGPCMPLTCALKDAGGNSVKMTSEDIDEACTLIARCSSPKILSVQATPDAGVCKVGSVVAIKMRVQIEPEPLAAQKWLAKQKLAQEIQAASDAGGEAEKATTSGSHEPMLPLFAKVAIVNGNEVSKSLEWLPDFESPASKAIAAETLKKNKNTNEEENGVKDEIGPGIVGGQYVIKYTVMNKDADWKTRQLPVEIILSDRAGNTTGFNHPAPYVSNATDAEKLARIIPAGKCTIPVVVHASVGARLASERHLDWPVLTQEDVKDEGEGVTTQSALDARNALLPPHPVSPSPLREGDVVRVTIHAERAEEGLTLSHLHCTVNGTRVGKGFKEHGEGIYTVEYIASSPGWLAGHLPVDLGLVDRAGNESNFVTSSGLCDGEGWSIGGETGDGTEKGEEMQEAATVGREAPRDAAWRGQRSSGRDWWTPNSSIHGSEDAKRRAVRTVAGLAPKMWLDPDASWRDLRRSVLGIAAKVNTVGQNSATEKAETSSGQTETKMKRGETLLPDVIRDSSIKLGVTVLPELATWVRHDAPAVKSELEAVVNLRLVMTGMGTIRLSSLITGEKEMDLISSSTVAAHEGLDRADAPTAVGEHELAEEGKASMKMFQSPCGICIDWHGNRLFVTDTAANSVVVLVAPLGKADISLHADGAVMCQQVIRDWVKELPVSASGESRSAELHAPTVFKTPNGVCFCHRTRVLYVCDTDNNRVVMFEETSGMGRFAYLSQIGGRGPEDNPLLEVKPEPETNNEAATNTVLPRSSKFIADNVNIVLDRPMSIAVDPLGRLFVLEATGRLHAILGPSGIPLQTVEAERNISLSSVAADSLCVSNRGEVYVAGAKEGDVVRVFTLTLSGQPSNAGPALGVEDEEVLKFDRDIHFTGVHVAGVAADPVGSEVVIRVRPGAFGVGGPNFVTPMEIVVLPGSRSKQRLLSTDYAAFQRVSVPFDATMATICPVVRRCSRLPTVPPVPAPEVLSEGRVVVVVHALNGRTGGVDVHELPSPSLSGMTETISRTSDAGSLVAAPASRARLKYAEAFGDGGTSAVVVDSRDLTAYVSDGSGKSLGVFAHRHRQAPQEKVVYKDVCKGTCTGLAISYPTNVLYACDAFPPDEYGVVHGCIRALSLFNPGNVVFNLRGNLHETNESKEEGLTSSPLPGRFTDPKGIAVDAEGTLYVAAAEGLVAFDRVILKSAAQGDGGAFVTRLRPANVSAVARYRRGEGSEALIAVAASMTPPKGAQFRERYAAGLTADGDIVVYTAAPPETPDGSASAVDDAGTVIKERTRISGGVRGLPDAAPVALTFDAYNRLVVSLDGGVLAVLSVEAMRHGFVVEPEAGAMLRLDVDALNLSAALGEETSPYPVAVPAPSPLLDASLASTVDDVDKRARYVPPQRRLVVVLDPKEGLLRLMEEPLDSAVRVDVAAKDVEQLALFPSPPTSADAAEALKDRHTLRAPQCGAWDARPSQRVLYIMDADDTDEEGTGACIWRFNVEMERGAGVIDLAGSLGDGSRGQAFNSLVKGSQLPLKSPTAMCVDTLTNVVWVGDVKGGGVVGLGVPHGDAVVVIPGPERPKAKHPPNPFKGEVYVVVAIQGEGNQMGVASYLVVGDALGLHCFAVRREDGAGPIQVDPVGSTPLPSHNEMLHWSKASSRLRASVRNSPTRTLYDPPRATSAAYCGQGKLVVLDGATGSLLMFDARGLTGAPLGRSAAFPTAPSAASDHPLRFDRLMMSPADLARSLTDIFASEDDARVRQVAADSVGDLLVLLRRGAVRLTGERSDRVGGVVPLPTSSAAALPLLWWDQAVAAVPIATGEHPHRAKVDARLVDVDACTVYVGEARDGGVISCWSVDAIGRKCTRLSITGQSQEIFEEQQAFGATGKTFTGLPITHMAPRGLKVDTSTERLYVSGAGDVVVREAGGDSLAAAVQGARGLSELSSLKLRQPRCVAVDHVRHHCFVADEEHGTVEVYRMPNLEWYATMCDVEAPSGAALKGERPKWCDADDLGNVFVATDTAVHIFHNLAFGTGLRKRSSGSTHDVNDRWVHASSTCHINASRMSRKFGEVKDEPFNDVQSVACVCSGDSTRVFVADKELGLFGFELSPSRSEIQDALKARAQRLLYRRGRGAEDSPERTEGGLDITFQLVCKLEAGAVDNVFLDQPTTVAADAMLIARKIAPSNESSCSEDVSIERSRIETVEERAVLCVHDEGNARLVLYEPKRFGLVPVAAVPLLRGIEGDPWEWWLPNVGTAPAEKQAPPGPVTGVTLALRAREGRGLNLPFTVHGMS